MKRSGFTGIVFILYFTDQLLNQVFGGYQSAQAAVLVNHQGHLIAATLHLFQEIIDFFAFWNEDRREHDSGKVEGFTGHQASQKILAMHNAGNILNTAAVDRVSGIHVFQHHADDNLTRCIQIEPYNAGARHHYLANTGMGEFEDIANVFLLGLADTAALMPLGNDMLDVLACNKCIPVSADPQHFHHRFAGNGQYAYREGADSGEEVDRPCDPQSDGISILQTDCLGNQLTDNQGGIGYQSDYRDGGERFRHSLNHGPGKFGEERAQVFDGDDAADSGGSRAGYCYADLYQCQQAVRVLLKIIDDLCPFVSFGYQTCNPAFAYRDHSKFGTGKKTIQYNH